MTIQPTAEELKAREAAREAGRRMAAPAEAPPPAEPEATTAPEAAQDEGVAWTGLSIGGEPIPDLEEAREYLGDMMDAGAQVITEETAPRRFKISRAEGMDAVRVCDLAVKFGAIRAGLASGSAEVGETHRAAFWIGEAAFYADFPAYEDAKAFVAGLQAAGVTSSVWAKASPKVTLEVDGQPVPSVDPVEADKTEAELAAEETTALARACGALWVGTVREGKWRKDTELRPRVSWTLQADPELALMATFTELDHLAAFMEAMDHRRDWRGLCRTIPHDFPGASEFEASQPKDEDEQMAEAIMEGFRGWLKAKEAAHHRRQAMKAGALAAVVSIGQGVAMGVGFALGLVACQAVFQALGF